MNHKRDEEDRRAPRVAVREPPQLGFQAGSSGMSRQVPPSLTPHGSVFSNAGVSLGSQTRSSAASKQCINRVARSIRGRPVDLRMSTNWCGYPGWGRRSSASQVSTPQRGGAGPARAAETASPIADMAGGESRSGWPMAGGQIRGPDPYADPQGPAAGPKPTKTSRWPDIDI